MLVPGSMPCLVKWLIFKNVSSSTSHKKTLSVRLYVFPSVQEFKKILPNAFIYESILIKIYMNTHIMNTFKIYSLGSF